MKLLRWGELGRERPGLVDAEGGWRDLSGHVDDIDGNALAPAVLERLRRIDPRSLPLVPPGVRLGACLGSVGHFLAIGLNYEDHAREAGAAIPEEPIVFSKAPSSISGPYDDLLIPPDSFSTDWEVEIAVVIGREASRIPDSQAMSVVAGYCVCNDFSERQWQLQRGGQWIKGKSAPGFGPLGPYLVTADEVADVHQLSLWTEVNGIRVQDGSSRHMIFSVPRIVSYLSQFMLLRSGDVITTGTPPGVGMGMKPPQFLCAGDSVRCGVEGLGEQRQVVRA